MRLHEFSNNFNPLLIEFWKQNSPTDLKYYCTQNNCQFASYALQDFLESKGITNSEIIPIGHISKGQKKKGWIKVDVPDTSLDAFTKEELAQAKEQGYNIRKKADRIAFIQQNNLIDEFTWIPHSWVEYRGEVLDPSGFYLDGKSGQFDRLVKNKSNLQSRYKYF